MKNTKYFLLFTVLFFVCFFVRVLVVMNGNFPFWFDSARDATLSREIFEKHHLKIQGPNASGTHDTVYHGVLYYYVIAPLYTASNGNPQIVVYFLGFLTSFAVIPVYLLALGLSNSSRVALLSALLYIFSYDAIRAGTWLSNPSLTALTLPVILYFLWLIFFQKQKKYLPWLALTLGISTQSVIFFVVLWGEVLLGWWYSSKKKKTSVSISRKEWLIALGIYIASILTMILAEFKIWHAGLLTPETFADFSFIHVLPIDAILGTVTLYLRKIVEAIFPIFPVGAFLLFLFSVFTFFTERPKEQKIFFLIAFSGPLWLLSWHYRDMFHAFIGLESLLCITLALFFQSLTKMKRGVYFAGALCMIYFISQGKNWQRDRLGRLTPYFLPQGAYLNDELHLIDKTYELSEGKPFSISTLTNPYGYSMTWAYLYDWHGKKKYGRVPDWFGPDQTGLFGSDLLPRKITADTVHFAIYEPAEGIPNYMKDTFTLEQQGKVGTPSAKMMFGSLELSLFHR